MNLFTENREDGVLTIVAGTTRSGKTAWTAQQVANAKRLLVWDAADDWGEKYNCRVIKTWDELAQACKSTAPDERLAFQCDITRENFETFCKLAIIFIKVRVSVLVIEEITDVSPIGKASPNWGQLTRKTLRYGPFIYALTHRPQDSDKTMLSMATIYHCHAQNLLQDQEYVARNMLSVPVEEVIALKNLEYLEKNNRDRTLIKGAISFGDDAKVSAKPKARKKPVSAKPKK